MSMCNLYQFCIVLIFVSHTVTATTSLVTSWPYAYRDRDFMLTCKLGNSQISNYFFWNRNDVSITAVQLSDCNTVKAPGSGPDLYSIYRYNCSLNTKDYNLIIPASRIANEEGSRWKCEVAGGAATSNTYTLQFYSAPTSRPSLIGYDGSPRFPGNTVTLTCKVDGGTPLATLSWTCKGLLVQGTNANTVTSAISTYTVTIDTSYNGQLCQCTASHLQWTEDNIAKIPAYIVQYPPTSNPVLSGYDGSVRYKGDTVILRCQVFGGSPLATLSWTCDGKPQIVNPSTSGTTVTSVLTLILQKGHNGKTCTCHGRHTDTRYTPNISSRTLIVYYPPSTPNLHPSTSTPFPWIEAGQGTLECKSQPGNPPTITYQWIRENVVIQGQTGDSLVITSLTRNDNRKSYKCKVSNDYTVNKNEDLMSQPITMDVEYRQVINIGTTPAYVRENGTFERLCTADGNPSPVIAWIPNINSSNGALLRLVNIMRNQTGPYTCIAKAQSKGSHGLLSNQDVLNLIVQYPPSVQAVISPSFTQEGEGVKMTCLARGVPDHYTYNGWTQIYRNTVIRSSNDFLSLSKNRHNISLPIVTYQDIGIYKCSAENGILDENGNINKEGENSLNMKFSAIFNSSMKFYSEINRTLVANIPFFCDPQAATVHNISLTKNNVDQKGSNDISIDLKRRSIGIKFYEKVIDVNGQEVVITFNSVNSNLQGTYTVGVRNFQEAPVSTFAFQVLLTGPPDHPKNFKILTSSTDSVIVTWLAGSNGGHQQTFVISYQQTNKNETLKTKNVTEIGGKELYVASIDNLLSETQYSFWIYAFNIKGNTKQYIDSANIIGIKTKTLKFCKSNSDGNNKILIGTVIGIIVGVIVEGSVISLLLWRKGIWNGNQCISGMKCVTSATQQEMQYEETDNKIEDANVYDGINTFEEGTENNQEDLSNQQQYEDLCNTQDSDAYQQLHLKGAEAIQMSSVYVNTVVK